jgi:hypothetical protein
MEEEEEEEEEEDIRTALPYPIHLSPHSLLSPSLARSSAHLPYLPNAS